MSTDVHDAVSAGPDTDLVKAGSVELVEQPMISIEVLDPDLANVREDLDLNEEFLASIAAEGVQEPLLIRRHPTEPGRCMVVEGHRRYFGALKVGREELPYSLLSVSEADAYLKAYVANHPKHRVNNTLFEQLAWLELARKAKATNTRIRQVTGMSRDQVKAARKVSRLSQQGKNAVVGTGYENDVVQLALLADLEKEFKGDQDALDELASAVADGRSLEYAADLIRQDRAEAARAAQVREELAAAGTPVSEALPEGAYLLEDLRVGSEDGRVLTGEEHADCPHRGAYFERYRPDRPMQYCTDPLSAGHGFVRAVDAERARLRADLVGAGLTVMESLPIEAMPLTRLRDEDGQEISVETHAECGGHVARLSRYGPAVATYACTDPDAYGHQVNRLAAAPPVRSVKPSGPSPSFVAKANKQWRAAAADRRAFLARWFTRKSIPKSVSAAKVLAFVLDGLVRMPAPLAHSLTHAPLLKVFKELAGGDATTTAGKYEDAGEARLKVGLLLPIAVAYEEQMCGDGERMYTWRTDRGNHACPRADAAAWLNFCADVLGRELTPIEAAVAAGEPYTGVTPGQAAVDQPGDDGEVPNHADAPDEAGGDTDGEEVARQKAA